MSQSHRSGMNLKSYSATRTLSSLDIVLFAVVTLLAESVPVVVLAEAGPDEWKPPSFNSAQPGNSSQVPVPGQATNPAANQPSTSQGQQAITRQSQQAIPGEVVTQQRRNRLESRLKTGLRRACPRECRPCPLETVLERCYTADERKQAVRVFWAAAEKAIYYDTLAESLKELESIRVTAQDTALLAALQEAHRARLAETQAALSSSLHDLRVAAKAASSSDLPYPDDMPHVGGYRTGIDQLYPQNTAPEALRRLDQLLALSRQSVYLHAAAADSAYDAWNALRDAYQAGRGSFWTAAQAWQLWVDEQRRCLQAITSYNEDILEFVTTAGFANRSAGDLVRMLVEPTSRGVVSSAEKSSGPASSGTPPASQMQPSPQALPQSSFLNRLPTKDGSLLPEHVGHHTTHTEMNCTDQLGGLVESLLLVDTTSTATIFAGTLPRKAAVHAAAVMRIARQSTLESSTSENSGLPAGGSTTPFSPELQNGGVRETLESIAGMAFRKGTTIAEGKTISLRQWLASHAASSAGRSQQIRDYWSAAVSQASLFVNVQRCAALAEAFPVILAKWNQPGTAEEMLYFHALRCSADATLQDSHAHVLKTALSGQTPTGQTEVTGFTPVSLPFFGPYDTKWEAIRQINPALERGTAPQLAAAIPQHYNKIGHLAQAVAYADRARIAAVSAYEQGTGGLYPLLCTTTLEFDLWIELVQAVGHYNTLIADYVATIQPNLDRERLLGVLGVRESE